MVCDFSLEGKTALVTGCRSGIGRAIAQAMAGAGADVIGVSSRLEIGDSPLKREIEGYGVRFFPYQYDLGDRAALYAFIDGLRREQPIVDILVNNAGIIRRAPVTEHGDEDWARVLELNLNAPFVLAREMAKNMVDRRSGKIIFIASLLSFQGGITVPGYAASKGGIKQLVMAMSNELAGKGVCVNGLAPGYIETEATQGLREDPARSRAILERIPAGRWGRPEDLAGTAVLLASGAADYITGTTIVVDGGWLGR